MHKCQNCGKEYEGNFCPDCGTKWEEDKTCPDCGATCSGGAKFCNNCGYNFTEKNSNRRKKGTKASEMSASAFALKVHKFIEYLPIVLFAVFAVGLFALFALPVAVMPGGEIFGEKIPTESYGNMYQMYKGIYKDIPAIQGVAIANILIAAYSLIIAFALCIVAFIRPLKYKRVNLFGIKNAVRLSEIIEWMAGFVYVLFIALTAAIIGKISAFDSGLGLISSGACVIIILALSCLFLLIHVSFRLFEKTFMDKKSPELSVKSQGEKYFNGEYAAAFAYKPVTPQLVGKPKTFCEIVKIVYLKRVIAIVLLSSIFLSCFVSVVVAAGYIDEQAAILLSRVLWYCVPAVALIVTLLFCPIKKVNIHKRLKRGLFIFLSVLSIYFVVFLIYFVFMDAVMFERDITNDFLIVDTMDSVSMDAAYIIEFILSTGIFGVIIGILIYICVKCKKLRAEVDSLGEAELSNQIATYPDYIKYTEQISAYNLQMYSYLNGKDNYMLKQPSKFSVWLNRNCKLIIATVIGYVLYAITAIVILLPL